ncbi:MAG TPA: helix-turn-helix domain-containing protein [Candidatus Dormibacteraeota bacterium]|nr:helix-turn-helix domain-containing protein [Candidatus Dormibacteraeota bacterium]
MRADQLEAVASAVRHDIMDHLVARGPLPVRDLAASLERKPTAVYAHLRRLEHVGLVVAVRVKRRRGRPALLYRSVATVVRLARAPRQPRNRAVMARVGRAMTSQAAKDYARAFQRGGWVIEGPRRNHWVFRGLVAPSSARLAHINRLFEQLTRLIWSPDPRPGRLMSITWALAPIGVRPRR